MPTYPERCAGSLLGVLAGDALGAVWEAMPGAVTLAAARARLEWRSSREVLRYTDDTQLTLALARHLVGDDPLVEDQVAWVARMLDAFEPGRGYGRGFRRLVTAWGEGMDVRQASTAVFAEGSYGNGAAMRVAPVALRWPDDDEARREAARNQAIVSHAHPVGIDGAVVLAEAVAVALRGSFGPDDLDAVADVARTGTMRDALAAVLDWVGRWRADDARLDEVADALGTDVTAERSVPAALWAAAAGGDLTEALALAVGLGGDTDTIAAMAGAVRGAADGRAAVPVEWVVAMEDDDRGVTHLLQLAEQLAAAAR